MATNAGDRPGTPEQYDREAAWERLCTSAGCNPIPEWEDMADTFFAELDAAVAWATRVERDRHPYPLGGPLVWTEESEPGAAIRVRTAPIPSGQIPTHPRRPDDQN